MYEAAISFPMLGDNFSINPPTYFNLFGLRIYYYGVITAIALVIGVIYCIKRNRDFGIREDNFLDIVLIAVPSAVIGARILFVLTNPDMYFAPGKWAEIPKIWKGGLAIYGGLALAVICILLYCRKKKISFGAVLDNISLGLMLGQVIGRWGNFINRELYGTETRVFCKMGLTLNHKTTYVHPVFLYESLWNLLGFVLLHLFSKKYRKFNGQLFLMYIAWYGLGRTFIDGLRVDVVKIIGESIGAYQLIALVSFCAAAVALVLLLGKHRDDPYLTVPAVGSADEAADKAADEAVADAAEEAAEEAAEVVEETVSEAVEDRQTQSEQSADNADADIKE